MSFEPIGAITIGVGLLCLLLGRHATVVGFVVFCTLGSAAAILVGSANVPPAHLFLVFLCVATLAWRRLLANAVMTLKVSEPGFWFLCLVIYGVLSSYVMPRLFTGSTFIVPLGASEYPTTFDGIVPLGPVSSNLTQSIYLVGDLACFIIIMAVGSTRHGFQTITTALIAYAFVNLCFGALDLLTSATGTQEAMQIIRNAQYTFHDEESVGNMRRIVGSWPEASAFASMTLTAFAFTATMWLYGRLSLLTGTIALMSLAFVVLSTSSTGLAGAAIMVVVLYAVALTRCGTQRAYWNASAVVAFAPLLVCIVGLYLSSDANIFARIYEYIDTLILSKSTTSSGMQRGYWNQIALSNFFDTWGLGVGLGTNRTSSFPLALLSNLGIPGSVFYLMFIAMVFGARRGGARTFATDVRGAARIACLSALAAGVLAGPAVDQGLLFYVFAGLACAAPERDRPTDGAAAFIDDPASRRRTRPAAMASRDVIPAAASPPSVN